MTAGPTTVVYHPRIGHEIVEAMRCTGAPGVLVGCTSEAEMRRALQDADVLMATHCALDAVVEAPRLRWIQSLASGVEDWMGPPGPPRVPITRMAGVYERYMAEYVLGYLLERTQQVARVRAAQAARTWDLFEKGSLVGQTIGVAGIGHVGSTVGRYARTFGMTVWGLCRERTDKAPDACFDRVFETAERAAFFSGLDVLVLAMPITPSTIGIIDEAALEALPSRALLVNIARGGLVDQQKLVRALERGEIAGAVLDTFEVEPLPDESPLWSLPNVTVTPHNAGAVHAHEVAAVCARNLHEFAAGRLPEPLVDMARGY
jgi:phosphoglycerate dehydrogenase-like enzyme